LLAEFDLQILVHSLRSSSQLSVVSLSVFRTSVLYTLRRANR
jgi:hypothetical protein